MINEQVPLLAYYGDDFTGSTDALEFLSRAGVKTVLFIKPPTKEQLARYEGVQAIGVAGMTRAMSPSEMDQELFPVFAALKALGAPHVHYKVCSTFDSSPNIGSIGRAADIGGQVFNAPFIPLLVAAPALGRYCLFGNLFARMGAGSSGEIYRIDRHPSMSRHPVTPMMEGDLRLHLAKQTAQSIGLVDVLTYRLTGEQAHKKLKEFINNACRIILFDALDEDQLLPIGQLLDKYAHKNKPLFSIGSSGIEMALGKYWRKQGLTISENHWQLVGKANKMLVVSGSCSPITAKQIDYACTKGFEAIAIAALTILAPAVIDIEIAIKPYIDRIVAFMQSGKPVIIHTSLGADDARIGETYQALAQQGVAEHEIRIKTAQLYGDALGLIILGVCKQISLQRLVIAGGDTSGFVARVIGIEAVEMIAPVSPGAPLCRAYAPGSAVHGVEVNFKGGQVGKEDYFITVLEGEVSS